jgi:hypothetical protein
MFELFAYIVTQVVGAGVVSTAVMTTAYYAFSATLIGYGVSRQRKRAAEARRASIQDRVVTLRSGDAPREIVYGRVRKGGVLAYGVSASATQPLFAQVVMLAAHECDGLEAVFVGEDRYSWDATTGNLSSPNPDAPMRYARPLVEDVNLPFTVDGSRGINVGQGFTVLGVSAERNRDQFDNPVWGDLGFSQQLDANGTPSGNVTIPEATPGQVVMVVARKRTPRSWIRVRFYDGKRDQLADEELIRISGGEWTANHRLRGICYAIIFIDPDPEVFSDGLPEFSFVLRGKRVKTAAGAVAWSRNPAECLKDYLTAYARWPESAVAATEFGDAAYACDSYIVRDPTRNIARYTCDGVLVQDETLHREHVQTLLSAMVGTLVPMADKAAMFAGVFRAPVMTLTDDDLIGPVTVTAFQPEDQAFNAVRGRYFDGEEAPGVPANRTYQRINFPPYVSSVYAAEDGGRVDYEDIELPMTVDPVRVQYIAKLHLHRSRQALKINATWKSKALALQVGKTYRLQLTRYGWHTVDGGLGKVFRVDEVQIDLGKMQVTATMQEEAPSIYDATYTEFDGRDPAPNTGFPSWREIAPPTGLTIASGRDYVRVRGDGTREPFARVTWNQSTEPSVLSGGWLELEWSINNSTQWQRDSRLDPYTTVTHIQGSVAGDFLRVRLRACNLITKSEWAYSVTTVNADAGPGTSATGVGVGVNAVANAQLRGGPDGGDAQMFDAYFALNAAVIDYAPGTEVRDPVTGQLIRTIETNTTSHVGRTLYLTWQGSTAAGYGVAGLAELPSNPGDTSLHYGRRALFRSKKKFPVTPGDVWELQAWVGQTVAGQEALPVLEYFNSAGQFLGDSSGYAGILPLATSNPVVTTAKRLDSPSPHYQRFAFVQIPPGVSFARWALPLSMPAAGKSNIGLSVLMPFAARSVVASTSSLRANPSYYLSNWNG